MSGFVLDERLAADSLFLADGPLSQVRLSPMSCDITWVGVTGFEPAASSSRTTRATKLRHTPLLPTATCQSYPIAGTRRCVVRFRPDGTREPAPESRNRPTDQVKSASGSVR